MEKRKEAMLKRLASRNEQRKLKTAEQAAPTNIDLCATEKAFLESTPSKVKSVDTKTPMSPAPKTTIGTMSPILSFDEKADKQMVAIAAWCNTMLGLDDTEEMDLGTMKAEACKKIQNMLTRKTDGAESQKQTTRRYHRIFEKNDSDEIKRKCRELLIDSGIDESINEMLSKNFMLVRNELAIYSDLALQTSLLRLFLSFHPLWLKAALEAIFDTKIEASPKFMVGAISRFFVEHVFTNQALLKNRKFAQGSGKPIVTALGKQALHRHFLLNAMKIMFIIETAHLRRVIPSLTRIFSKSSQFKCLDDLFSELTKELLSGSSAPMRRAFAKIGFTPSYKQSFIESYDYQARGFESFSDGLILAKLVETVGEMPYGQLLLKLRDPAGDRIRKVNNVKTVLAEMANIGICIEDVTAADIVAGKKAEVLTVLWNIIGVRVAKEKRIRMSRASSPEVVKSKKRRSVIHDDMSSEVLKMCKAYARELDVEVLDLDSLTDGQLLSKAWSFYVPMGTPVEQYEGQTLWEKVVVMADVELRITRGIDQNMALFAKTFFEKMQMVREYHEKAELERQSLAATERSTSPCSVDNATFTIPSSSSSRLSGRQSMTQFSERQSIDSTFNNATFTISRDSVDSDPSMFKMPKTPSRVTFVKSAIVHMLEETIKEEEDENEETIVPSTAKKRTVNNVTNVFGNSPDSTMQTIVEDEVVQKEEIQVEESAEAEKADTQQEDVTLEQEHTICDKENDPSATEVLLENDGCPVKEEDKCEEVGVTVNENHENVVVSKQQETAEPDDAANVSVHKSLEEMKPEEKETTTVVQEEKKMDMCSESETETVSSADNLFSDEQQKMEDVLRSIRRDQVLFVEQNHLNVVFEKENDTPELKKILRDAHRLKKKQQKMAKMLGAIERQALAENREEAFIESELDERSDAGHDDFVMFEVDGVDGAAENLENSICMETSHVESPTTQELIVDIGNSETVEPAEEKDASLSSDKSYVSVAVCMVTPTKKVYEEVVIRVETKVSPRMSIENAAASVIQKTVRGFLARRRMRAEIEAMKERAVEYKQVLAREDQMFSGKDKGDASLQSSSAETKLRKYSLHGLTDANLHVVNLAATIIDRLTDLVPSLTETFVVELNGVKLALDILLVADQGMSYTSILHPLLNILQKSFVKVPEADTNATIQPLLAKLSPRLFQLILVHCDKKSMFMALATTLISIGRRFPNTKTSHMGNSKYVLKKATSKVTDPECKETLMTLQTVCDALL